MVKKKQPKWLLILKLICSIYVSYTIRYAQIMLVDLCPFHTSKPFNVSEPSCCNSNTGQKPLLGGILYTIKTQCIVFHQISLNWNTVERQCTVFHHTNWLKYWQNGCPWRFERMTLLISVDLDQTAPVKMKKTVWCWSIFCSLLGHINPNIFCILSIFVHILLQFSHLSSPPLADF